MLSNNCCTLDYLVSNRQILTRRTGSGVLIPMAELKRFSRIDRLPAEPAETPDPTPWRYEQRKSC